MKTMLGASALSLLIVAGAPVRAQQDDGDTALDDIPHVTILGTAHAEVVPDLAEITLGVAIEKPRAVDAMAETSRITASVIEAAKAQGIAPKDIGTQNITLAQTFDNVTDPHGSYIGRKARGFQASNTIVIRIHALDKAGTLVQSLIDKGTTRFDGISFSTENPTPILETLYAEAVRDAKRKATIAAEALGVKLGRVLLIERPHGARAADTPPMAVSRMAMPAPGIPVPIEGGTQSLATQMEVTWALES